MSVAQPRLDKKQVKAIKKAIVRGESLSDLAEEYGVAYMVIYKIAAGLTWKKVKPRGRLIGVRDYRDRRTMSLPKCERIALTKIRKRVSNQRIAEAIDVSESTVRRAVMNGRAALAIRLERATLNGTAKVERKRLGLTKEQASTLSSEGAPEWIRREIEIA